MNRMNKEEMNEVSMAIILHSGNARIIAEEVLENIKNNKLSEIEELLKKANDEIVKAHGVQTDLIQKEAGGEEYENCLLFNHAQDTLMTSKLKVELAKDMYEIFEVLNKKIGGVK